MRRYINSTDITEQMHEAYSFRLKDRCYADSVSYAPADDDTNYTAMSAFKILPQYGRGFTPKDVIDT